MKKPDLQKISQENEDTERYFSEHLVALVEITSELSMSKTVDDLCLNAVQLGSRRLGFDRLGIWFRTEEPDVIAGSFGMDERGRIRDERDLRIKVNPEDPDGLILLSKEPFALAGEAPLINMRGEPVGNASQIFAALWNGKHVIGHVSADNHLRQKPLVKIQCELLRLFGSVLGTLYKRKHIEMEREKLIAELQEALSKIKTLHGLLPICASCKNIRDDKGYWSQIESYISSHSEAEFTHCICPKCTKKLYPELYKE